MISAWFESSNVLGVSCVEFTCFFWPCADFSVGFPASSHSSNKSFFFKLIGGSKLAKDVR